MKIFLIKKLHFLIQIACLGLTLLSISACSTFPQNQNGTTNLGQRHGSSSTLVNYLYPRGERPPGISLETPHISVPTRIGIAFVPSKNNAIILNRALKNRLLAKVRKQFRYLSVVDTIKIIPPHVLTPSGGFNDMKRVARQFEVDLIALVSHNQIRAITNNSLSLTYWTIVGALIIPGNSHHIETFIDTAVFDVNTGKLLMQASGRDRVYRQSSAFALMQKHRQTSRRSLIKATDNMITTLNTELAKFRQRVRQGSNEADVHYKRNYRGNIPKNKQNGFYKSKKRKKYYQQSEVL